ncbi:hypothetical protein [Vibrio sonorensis]|uniref:hypothetical protein n=1 Tax=Vibrio sonorensis TaxID=1004316 RepID=UPI0008DB0392|nr:hypothetical protein [Vibrio sonorensis]
MEETLSNWGAAIDSLLATLTEDLSLFVAVLGLLVGTLSLLVAVFVYRRTANFKKGKLRFDYRVTGTEFIILMENVGHMPLLVSSVSYHSKITNHRQSIRLEQSIEVTRGQTKELAIDTKAEEIYLRGVDELTIHTNRKDFVYSLPSSLDKLASGAIASMRSEEMAKLSGLHDEALKGLQRSINNTFNKNNE